MKEGITGAKPYKTVASAVLSYCWASVISFVKLYRIL